MGCIYQPSKVLYIINFQYPHYFVQTEIEYIGLTNINKPKVQLKNLNIELLNIELLN